LLVSIGQLCDAGYFAVFDKNAVVITLHNTVLLRGSRIKPKLSARAQNNGLYDYNAIHIAPSGIRVITYEPPSERGSWASHGENGWYVGPSFDHYHHRHQTTRQSIQAGFPTHQNSRTGADYLGMTIGYSIPNKVDKPTRHINIQYFFVRDHIAAQEVSVEYCPT
jgi:hypothetical protein